MHCRRLQHPKLCARSMRLMHAMSPRQTQLLHTRTVAGKEWQRHAWCTAVAAIINCSGLFSTSNLEGVARFNTCTIRPGKLLVHEKVKLRKASRADQEARLAIERQSAAISHIEEAMRLVRQSQEQKAAAEHRAYRAEAQAAAEKRRADEAEAAICPGAHSGAGD